MRAVVDFLMEQETMTGKQFRACMEGTEPEADDSKNIFFGEDAQE